MEARMRGGKKKRGVNRGKGGGEGEANNKNKGERTVNRGEAKHEEWLRSMVCEKRAEGK